MHLVKLVVQRRGLRNDKRRRDELRAWTRRSNAPLQEPRPSSQVVETPPRAARGSRRRQRRDREIGVHCPPRSRKPRDDGGGGRHFWLEPKWPHRGGEHWNSTRQSRHRASPSAGVVKKVASTSKLVLFDAPAGCPFRRAPLLDLRGRGALAPMRATQLRRTMPLAPILVRFCSSSTTLVDACCAERGNARNHFLPESSRVHFLLSVAGARLQPGRLTLTQVWTKSGKTRGHGEPNNM